ncbi:MAG: methyltransferase domain-containing protein [Planctomycetota bacterium]
MPRRVDLEPEWMDAPGVDEQELTRSLGFIRRINTLLRYNAATAHVVRDTFGEPASVLDVCCGSNDLAEQTGWPTVGLDFHGGTLKVATGRLVRGDALRLPFADDAFDVAVCQMALHHFEDDDVRQILSEMTRVTRRGWVAADLLRRRRAAMWIRLFTLFAGPMVRHDARLSVRQAWSPAEARSLGEAVGATYREHFGHRFTLTLTKPTPSS